MRTEALLAYILLTALSSATPGPAVLLALRNGAMLGLRAAFISTMGNQLGLLTLAGGSLLGLGLVLDSWPWIFGVIKWVGAAYLVWLGWRMWRSSGAFSVPSRVQGPDEKPHARGPSPWVLARTGMWISLTNPKAVLFFTALFPQFIHAQAPVAPQFALLLGVTVAISVACLLAYAWLANHSRQWLGKPGIALRINRAAGGVFMAFGAALIAFDVDVRRA